VLTGLYICFLLQARYEAVVEKLSARQPIAQLASRKQFIEYKLKLATRVGSDGSGPGSSGVSPADRAALIAELTEVQANVEALVRQYERRFGEPYLRMTPAGPDGGAPPTPGGSNSNNNTGAYAALNSPRQQTQQQGGVSWEARTNFTPSSTQPTTQQRHSIAGPTTNVHTATASPTSPSSQTHTSHSAASFQSPPAGSKMNTVGSGVATNKSAFKSVPPAR